MFYTIYKITNILNEKYYIGMHKTDNLDDGYMGSGKLIKRAINKYGLENFKKEILHIFDNAEDMKNKEKELVVLSENAYNLCYGGHGGFGYINKTGKNKKYTKEEASRGRNTLKIKWDTDPDWADNQRKIRSLITKKSWQEGKMRMDQLNSDSAKAKRKETYSSKGHQQGSKNSQYGTCWVTDGFSSKKIKKEELDFWLKNGYYKGRILAV